MVCQGRLDILPFLTLTYSLWGLRKSLAESKLKLTMQQISKNITFQMDFRLSTMNFKKILNRVKKKIFAISLKNYFLKGLIKVEATVYLFLQNGGKEQCFISWLVGVDAAMQICILFCFLLVLYLAEIYTSI